MLHILPFRIVHYRAWTLTFTGVPLAAATAGTGTSRSPAAAVAAMAAVTAVSQTQEVPTATPAAPGAAGRGADHRAVAAVHAVAKPVKLSPLPVKLPPRPVFTAVEKLDGKTFFPSFMRSDLDNTNSDGCEENEHLSWN